MAKNNGNHKLLFLYRKSICKNYIKIKLLLLKYKNVAWKN